MSRVILVLTAAVALLMAEAGAQDKSDKKAAKAEKAAAKAGAPVKGEPTAKTEGFDAFKNVKAKNIFDPSRRAIRGETPVTARQPTNASRSRTLVLTGTMVTDGKTLAFFGGSAAEGSRVISVGNSVANYKLTAISATQVALEHEGKSLTLDVGRQISFESAPGEAAPAGPVVEAAPEPAADVTGTPSVPGPAGDKAEILRRMMERRAKESGK